MLDKHNEGSAKEHERLRRGKEESYEEYDLTINCHLPKRDVILTNTHNKRELGRILRTYNYGENVETDDDMFQHDEADITIISHVLQAASEGKKVIRVKSDDTDVFVLLVYWVYKKNIKAKVHMQKWDSTVLNINETCKRLGEKSLQVLGMHALSGCDTSSYPCGKGKVSAIKALSKTDLSELDTILGDPSATHAAIMECARKFFAVFFGFQPTISMEDARLKMFLKYKKTLKIQNLPPTSTNLMLHALRAHLQVMLWKSADQPGPPPESEDITKFGWSYTDGFPMPIVSQYAIAPEALLDVVKCSCKAEGKLCETDKCSCRRGAISCTGFCSCYGTELCKNPYTMTHGVDHNMPDFDISMLQTIVDDNEVDDSQGIDMESEEEDGDDIEMPEYMDCSDIYDDDNGEGDEDLDGSFIVVRGASKRESRPPAWRKDYV